MKIEDGWLVYDNGDGEDGYYGIHDIESIVPYKNAAGSLGCVVAYHSGNKYEFNCTPSYLENLIKEYWEKDAIVDRVI